MDYQEIIEKIKPELDKTINYLNQELAKIRTTGLSVSLFEDIRVECFGKRFPLKSLATITLSEGNRIIIRPWDVSYLEAIRKEIMKSPLGINPVLEGDSISISLPPLSQETRSDLVKFLSQKAEDSKRKIRYWRQVAWKEIQEKFSKGEIREDDKYRGKDRLQELIDEYNEKIKEMVERKKREILE